MIHKVTLCSTSSSNPVKSKVQRRSAIGWVEFKKETLIPVMQSVFKFLYLSLSKSYNAAQLKS